MKRSEELLAYRFGAGQAVALKGSATIALLEDALVGDGNSVRTPSGPDEAAMAKVGHVDRALLRILLTHRYALAAAYGDPGHAATNDGRQLGRRWLAVAPLTEEAQRRGREWRAERNDPNDHGNPGYQWWHHILATKNDQVGQKAVERQAKALLAAALEAFEEALGAIEADQRAIRQTAQRGQPPRGLMLLAA